MARFILDIANLSKEQIKNVQHEIIKHHYIADKIVTIICVDETNDNQFHNEFENGETNELSKTQIENHKKVCNQ